MSGYILCIKSAEITEAVQRAIDNPPKIPTGYGARLKTDLTWELYELPTKPELSDNDELTDTEALSVLIGGVT